MIMDQKTYRHIDDLRRCMEEDPRTKAFSEAKKLLEEDPVARTLYEEAEKARADYLSLRLELGESDEETLAAMKVFHQKKLALDEHPSASEYRRVSAELNLLYRALDDILFGPFQSHPDCGDCR